MLPTLWMCEFGCRRCNSRVVHNAISVVARQIQKTTVCRRRTQTRNHNRQAVPCKSHPFRLTQLIAQCDWFVMCAHIKSPTRTAPVVVVVCVRIIRTNQTTFIGYIDTGLDTHRLQKRSVHFEFIGCCHLWVVDRWWCCWGSICNCFPAIKAYFAKGCHTSVFKLVARDRRRLILFMF